MCRRKSSLINQELSEPHNLWVRSRSFVVSANDVLLKGQLLARRMQHCRAETEDDRSALKDSFELGLDYSSIPRQNGTQHVPMLI